MKKRTKIIWITVIALVIVLTGGIFVAGMYFYHMAVVPGHKDFLSNQTKISKQDPLYHQKKWYQDVKKQQWHEVSATDHLKLNANYVAADKATNKTIVIAHGFGADGSRMGAYAGMFHDMGYNILVPDDRGAGSSEGNYIGYGWPDRLDYVKWINQVIKRNGQNSEIVMFGVSMGGATTMMVSGEKTPSQVKAFIEDCGYTSVYDEISYQAKQMYNLPAWPLVPTVSAITKVRAGYGFKEASALKQVKKNQKPMLFIHGDKDDFVPTRMVYPLYKADKGPKELAIFKGAGHAKSYASDPSRYESVTHKFLEKYFN
ncbi:alpha/beta hydrolase [Secundilactobacillus oryzae JCM 18671]|uniref:Alpha/beta hydrolase n=1 Tax=Secundilactobacillus oryzae JCM 18671 TaxID=1291743 RepID=A0A081BIV3_9LACO|nr:alpha/beta hydrolase [Secundilactobacillus oryzae]GAK47971.1 alpha/beta hydrolase [Secundilactobacillus oryzae JCM 18671]